MIALNGTLAKKAVVGILGGCALVFALGQSGCSCSNRSVEEAEVASDDKEPEETVVKEGQDSVTDVDDPTDPAKQGEVEPIEETTENPEGVEVSPEAKEELEAAAEEMEEAALGEQEQLRSDAEAEGLTVMSGTLSVISGTDLCDLEGLQAAAVGDPDQLGATLYLLLMFDEETELNGTYGDNSGGTRSVTHVGLGVFGTGELGDEDAEAEWTALDGARVCVAGRPWFPSDVSLPVTGRLAEARLLYVE